MICSLTMTIGFVTYETSFAPCGGIAAVIGHLPAAVGRCADRYSVMLRA